MSRRDLGATSSLVILAGIFVAGALWPRALAGEGVPSADIYAAQYPDLVYALDHWRGGHGLLWNRLQNCGQPFLPTTLLGLFYPLHALFLWLDPNLAFVVVAALHLAIGGVGTYLWCRALGCEVLAAFCGAVAFTLGAPAVTMAVWVPTTILAAYAWLPMALFCCELLLRRPTLRVSLALGVVLSIQALPGYPQINLFTYQFILLRVAWETVTGARRETGSVWGLLLVALVLPVLLAGVQLYPMAEFARLSLRNKELTPAEANPFGVLTWVAFRQDLASRSAGRGVATVIALVPMALTGLAIGASRHRRMAVFFCLAGLVYLGLIFETPLQAAYLHIPLARTFRVPERFFWMLGMMLSPIIAFAVDALLRPARRGVGRWAMVAAPLAGAAVFWALAPNGLVAREWLLLAALGAACALAAFVERAVLPAGLAIGFLLTASLWQLNAKPFLSFMADGRALYGKAAAFEFVRSRARLQDRMYLLGQNLDWGLNAKTASLFGLPSIDDYEPQTSLRYGALFVRLLYDRPMQTINMHVLRIQPIPLNRSLFDLTAGRFIVADEEFAPKLGRRLRPPLQRVWQQGRTSVYENQQALPRAFFVPRLEVVPDAAELLDRLASPTHAAREVALVEALPADGFLGGEGQAAGEVDIAEDLSERLALRVRATAPGFVSLQDQMYPGWRATVNGAATEILRANYAFRAVRVPAGESRVVFEYRPWPVYLGAVTSLGGLAAVLVYWLCSRPASRKRFRAPREDASRTALADRSP